MDGIICVLLPLQDEPSGVEEGLPSLLHQKGDPLLYASEYFDPRISYRQGFPALYEKDMSWYKQYMDLMERLIGIVRDSIQESSLKLKHVDDFLNYHQSQGQLLLYHNQYLLLLLFFRINASYRLQMLCHKFL